MIVQEILEYLMGSDPAFLMYVDDWLSSRNITLMSPAEEGAYIRLLCYAWQDPDCRLPNNDNDLAALSRLGDDWFNGCGERIRACFVVDGETLYNERLLEERQKRDSWKKKLSDAGSKGMKSRWDKGLRKHKPVITELKRGNNTRVGDEDKDQGSLRGKSKPKKKVSIIEGLAEPLKTSVEGWVAERKSHGKKPTDNAVRLALKKVEGFYPGDIGLQAKVFDRSTEGGWSGVFKLKGGDDQAATPTLTEERAEELRNSDFAIPYEEETHE